MFDMYQGVEPDKRKVIYLGAARALAALHRVDVDSIGLQNYGRRHNYCKRQVILSI
jgi:acyl-CoA dehydrogenase